MKLIKINDMFTQACFIRKNTSELVEKLKELGYNQSLSARGNCVDSLQTTWNSMGGSVYGFLSIPSDKIEEPIIDDINGVNCRTNEELFLAIAALRDDSDKHQWFIHDDSDWNDEPNIFWYKCESESINDDMALNLMCNDCRKATVEELIKHFSV